MIYRMGMFIAISLILSSVLSLLTIEVVASQVAESNSIIHSVTMLENTSNATGAVSSNNTIILNAAEVGEETYRWVNSTGGENPNLNLISDTEYTIKIDNPTDEEHELIIDSESDGKTSAIAQSPEIEPGKNAEFKFIPNQVGELGYHCEYHPDQMNGTINVS